jgi:hypothetical protein
MNDGVFLDQLLAYISYVGPIFLFPKRIYLFSRNVLDVTETPPYAPARTSGYYTGF